jgi:hypothetical protein
MTISFNIPQNLEQDILEAAKAAGYRYDETSQLSDLEQCAVFLKKKTIVNWEQMVASYKSRQAAEEARLAVNLSSIQ